jgi:superfamily II DNA or RNA helicase
MKIDNGTATLEITETDSETYPDFLKAKTIPRYQIERDDNNTWFVSFPAEYAERFGKEYKPDTPDLPLPMPDFLFDRQKVGVRISWFKQRYALFWDAGLGKTLIFLELARQLTALGKKCLIVSPLNVIAQTMETADEFYDDLFLASYHGERDAFSRWRKEKSSLVGITNHMAFRRPLDLDGIDALFLDESGILKNPHGTLRNNLVSCSKGIQYKYCYSATQAPNERIEYAQSAVFLEVVRSDTEFRAMFFVQKDEGWVLRRHRVKGFYDFLASWSMFMRRPEAYGLENNLNLPPYREIQQNVRLLSEQVELAGQVLPNEQATLPEVAPKPNGFVDRGTLSQISKGFLYQGKNSSRKIISVPSLKPDAIANIAAEHVAKGEKIIIWTVYDEEGELVKKAIEQNITENVLYLTGKTPIGKRAALVDKFRRGGFDIVISKPRLLGMGLNLHVANVIIFSGLSDSYEAYYQAIKRAWRYPQNKTVTVYLPTTLYERVILDNVLTKRDRAERDYVIQEKMYTESLYDEIADYLETNWHPPKKGEKEMHDPVITDEFEVHHTDSISATLDGFAENKIDLIVTSIPFRNDLFAYIDDVADMGNSGGVGQAGRDEFIMHLHYALTGMLKTLKPGRLACIEIGQSPLRLGVDGVIGMSDFRGDVVRAAEEVGFVQFGEIPVLGNPQAEAIVKHITTLSNANFQKDRASLVPMLLDYIIVLKKPGKNDVPILSSDFGSFESWIEHADGIWQEKEFNKDKANYQGVSQKERFSDYLRRFEIALDEALQLWSGAFYDIDQTKTLNTPYTRGRTKEIEDSDKHVCPFALPLVNRLIRLYSNPSETVLDPFGGIGSVLHEGIKLDRHVISIELKAEYFLQSVEIAQKAVNEARQLELF